MIFTNEETLNILKTLLNKDDDYISVIDLEGKYLYKNLPLTKLLNTDENSNNTSIFNSIHSSDKEKVRDIFKGIVNSGNQQSAEYKLLDNNRNYLDIRGTFYALKNKEEQIEKILLVSNDISKEKHLEEEINTLKIAVSQTSDQVVVTTKEGVIEYVNPAFEKVTGYTTEESIGKTIRKLISSKNDQKFYDEVWGRICNGETFHGEVINKTKNGEFFSCDKTISPIKDKNGNITHFVSTSKTLEIQI